MVNRTSGVFPISNEKWTVIVMDKWKKCPKITNLLKSIIPVDIDTEKNPDIFHRRPFLLSNCSDECPKSWKEIARNRTLGNYFTALNNLIEGEMSKDILMF